MRNESSIASVHTPATRWSLLILSTGTVLLLFAVYHQVIAPNGYNLFEWGAAGLFVVLAFWIAFSFWCCTLGLARAFLPEQEEATAEPASEETPVAIGEWKAGQARTAILVPVYNESPVAVLARVQAMLDSLAETGHARQFELYILSDTTNPEVWLEEELVWSRMLERTPQPTNVFYRRRPKNKQRKAGNIADFCTRWGRNYDYMIVLDADSLMAGSTLVEMVERMHADPRLAILQVPPRPVNRTSLFARLQQFAATIYSPICIYGFDAWSCQQGNYWGHNAIIRIAPFMRHCELPILPGKKPLGGEILSHDFVEAALLASNGWKVRLAHDLDGSYEECPTTLIDYLIRDQRWCQGNIQHSRLVLSEGFHLMSRMHFLMGVMAYAASPIWFLFMLLSLAGYWREQGLSDGSPATPAALTLFTSVMVLLLLPKLWSLLILMKSPARLQQLGGWVPASLSVLLETAISILIAPIMAFYHSCFVFNTLRGKTVSWNSQRRDEAAVTFRDAVSSHASAFFAYLAAGGAVAILMPDLLLWFIPLLAGPLLIFPLAMLLSSRSAGLALRRCHLLLIPEEREVPELISSVERTTAQWEQELGQTDHAILQRLLKESRFRNVHYKILQETSVIHAASQEEVAQAEELISRGGDLASLPREITCSLLCDRQATERLARHYQQTMISS